MKKKKYFINDMKLNFINWHQKLNFVYSYNKKYDFVRLYFVYGV